MKVNSEMVLVVAGVAAVAYLVHRAASAAAAAVEAVNPLNNDNIFARGVNSVVSPSGTESLGTKLYDWFHGGGVTPLRTWCTRAPSGVVSCHTVQ